ncbi:MAG: hypothetical protein O3A14_06865 [Cyanobacteria bacterium]|nr:hypothetical protein [Cyanobacteriota bacterium]
MTQVAWAQNGLCNGNGDIVTEKNGCSQSQSQRSLNSLNANQIVYLAQGDTRLYGEVIQVVESRDRCWVRPLAIVDIEPDPSHHQATCHQIPQGPDVIWPLSWFSPALDTDWLAILTTLPHTPSYDRATANQRLRQLWQDRESRLFP